MTIVKGRTCHAPFHGCDGLGTCNTNCPHYIKYEPCPMWVPSRYWYSSICDGCIYNSEKCDYEYTSYPPTGVILACFGFKEKPMAVQGECDLCKK